MRHDERQSSSTSISAVPTPISPTRRCPRSRPRTARRSSGGRCCSAACSRPPATTARSRFRRKAAGCTRTCSAGRRVTARVFSVQSAFPDQHADSDARRGRHANARAGFSRSTWTRCFTPCGREPRNLGDPAELAAVLRQAGLDADAFLALVNDPAVKEQLKKQYRGGGGARGVRRADLLRRRRHVLGPGPARFRRGSAQPIGAPGGGERAAIALTIIA